ncbi:MAG: MBL fold metallo-hydrolase [Chloroflexi bacterium]|nr:MBL fold metallo-hydrolase [Chloroflexota bacterium]
MEITYLGLSCFRLRGQEMTIITDPLPWKGPPRTATVVTVSHDHPRHNQVEWVAEVRKVLRGPGEFEIGSAYILGTPTFHDNQKGKLLGTNTIFRIEMEGSSLCHLGDLGHQLSAAQVEELGAVDILFLPVGGVSTLDAAQAAEAVNLLEPKIIIPMHYRAPGLAEELGEVELFLRHMGVGQVEALPRLSITRSLISQEAPRVVLLEPPRP